MRVMANFGLAMALAIAAPAGADVGGTVTSGGVPVAGAFVAVTGSGTAVSAVTDSTGQYTIDTDAGTFRVAVAAPGHAAAVSTDVVVAAADETVVHDVELVPSGVKLVALPVFGGQIASIAADGRSGVFYALTSVIPQVFRTSDYGGTWTPVTLAVDDATHGLPGSNVGSKLTTSGWPGEVAVEVSGTVYYSTDFGVTWQAVAGSAAGGSGGPNAQRDLFWSHAGSTNILLHVQGTTTLRADMSAPTPTWSTQSPGYLAGDGDRMAVANGSDAGWVAVVRSTGDLALYDLAENPPATDLSAVTGLPAPATLVRLGGARHDGVPPDALLVYADSSGKQARMASKSGGTDFTTLSATTTVNGCGEQAGSIGAIAPVQAGQPHAGRSRCVS